MASLCVLEAGREGQGETGSGNMCSGVHMLWLRGDGESSWGTENKVTGYGCLRAVGPRETAPWRQGHKRLIQSQPGEPWMPG